MRTDWTILRGCATAACVCDSARVEPELVISSLPRFFRTELDVVRWAVAVVGGEKEMIQKDVPVCQERKGKSHIMVWGTRLTAAVSDKSRICCVLTLLLATASWVIPTETPYHARHSTHRATHPPAAMRRGWRACAYCFRSRTQGMLVIKMQRLMDVCTPGIS